MVVKQKPNTAGWATYLFANFILFLAAPTAFQSTKYATEALIQDKQKKTETNYNP